MAKQYYTLAETAGVLKLTEDQVRAIAREGKLREYRDAGKLNYRVEEVDRLAAKEGSSIFDLADDGGAPAASGPAESGELHLADSGPIDGRPAAEPPRSPAPAPAPSLSDSVDDLALAGSSIIDFKDEPKPSPRSKEDTKITSVGINVFDDDLQIDVDPMAETRITASPTELGMGTPPGGVGSGSGLMDLTRESDETSLGAELLDVISPTDSGETETQADSSEIAETATAAVADSASAESYMAPAAVESAAAVQVVSYPLDPSGPIFTGLMAAAMVMLMLVGLASASAIQGVWPSFLAFLTRGMNLYIYLLGGGVLLAGIGAAVGYFASQSGGKPRPARSKSKGKPAAEEG